jgi:hypothetical protein
MTANSEPLHVDAFVGWLREGARAADEPDAAGDDRGDTRSGVTTLAQA